MCSANSWASRPLDSHCSVCSFLLPDWPLLGKPKTHLLNHPTIDAVPDVSQLHGQLVDYFLLVMVLANATLLGLRRRMVAYVDRKEFKGDYELSIHHSPLVTKHRLRQQEG